MIDLVIYNDIVVENKKKKTLKSRNQMARPFFLNAVILN